MNLMWPTCLTNFFYTFHLVNFHSEPLNNMYYKGNFSEELEINKFFTNTGYETKVFMYNAFDTLIIAAAILCLIPVCFVINKLIKV